MEISLTFEYSVKKIKKNSEKIMLNKISVAC